MNGGLSIYSIKYKILKKVHWTKPKTKPVQTKPLTVCRGGERPRILNGRKSRHYRRWSWFVKQKRGLLGMNKGNKNDKEKNRKRQLNLVQAMEQL